MSSPRRHLSVDELTQRASTGLAIRRGDLKISDPIPSSYMHNGAEMDGMYEQPTPRLEGVAGWPRKSGAATGTGGDAGSTPPVHVSRFTERTSLGPSLATSNLSSTQSKDSLQRRNTGLRATLKRMFSSKKDRTTALQKRSASQGDPSRVLSMAGPGSQHQPSHNHFSVISPSRALHSHAPSPHLRMESADVVRSSPTSGQLGQRRNTVPSLLLVPPEESTALSKESPQPGLLSPKHDVASKRYTPSPVQFRRRSRSADDLADILNSTRKSSDRRDRAEEIAFWRNSVVIDPLPDFPTSQEMPDAERTDSMPRSEPPEARPRPSLEPVQDFDFGLGEQSNDNRTVTLLERVNTLEIKLFDFEFALTRLQGTEVAKPNPPKIPTRQRSPFESQPYLVHSSRHDLPTNNDRSHHSSPGESWQPTSPGELRADRASKATTIKPIHQRSSSARSQSSSPSSVRLTREQYDALFSLIQDEKTARQHLEVQIMELQKEVDGMKSPVYAYIRPAKYPTPSPDSFHDPATATTPRTLHRSTPMRSERELHETSRFSMTETDPETEADEPYPEIYETPQETKFRFETSRHSPPGMI